MKRIILLVVLLTATVWSYSQSDSVFYYYHGKHETYYQHNNAICFFLPPSHTIPATLEAEMHRLNLHLSNEYSFLYPCYVAESNDNRPISDSVLHLLMATNPATA